MTGVWVKVPSALIDISGLRCGSGSTLCIHRSGYNASNLETHTTGKDIIPYANILDGPVMHKLGFIENTLGSVDKVVDEGSGSEDGDSSDEEESLLTTGEEWRAQLNHRGFSHVNAIQRAIKNGGPEERNRFYEANLHFSELHGAPTSQHLACSSLALIHELASRI